MGIISKVKRALANNKVSCFLLKQKYRLYYGSNFDKGTYFYDTVFENIINIEHDSSFYCCYLGVGSDIGANNVWIKTKIGRYCLFDANNRNIVGHHPIRKYVAMNSQFFRPGRSLALTNIPRYTDEYKYADHDKNFYNVIGNDVYITNDVLILEGVKIGDGAVITPGSVVTKNVPPYAIVRGNPARVETYRFKDSEIEFLEKFQWWNKDIAWIRKHIELFDDIKKMRAYIEENDSDFYK